MVQPLKKNKTSKFEFKQLLNQTFNLRICFFKKIHIKIKNESLCKETKQKVIDTILQ